MIQLNDKVKPKIFSQGSDGTVIAINDPFYLVEFEDKNGDRFSYSYRADELIKANTSLMRCTCGAAYTYAPNLHVPWCDRHGIDKDEKW